MRTEAGLSNGREVSLLSEAQASASSPWVNVRRIDEPVQV
jgi:hypothetical protein